MDCKSLLVKYSKGYLSRAMAETIIHKNLDKINFAGSVDNRISILANKLQVKHDEWERSFERAKIARKENEDAVKS